MREKREQWGVGLDSEFGCVFCVWIMDFEQREVQEHRAQSCDKREQGEDFLCITFGRHDDVEIEPLDHLVDYQSPQKMYKKVVYGEYLRSSMQRRLEGKAHTQMAKVET
ncbi:hypothetical protein Ddye_010880 [Dipteronia dyeriana]|uniref:Uncharacterized protein n=1 Tax=Dipteronia dyeriana TaxID=168575 RepID=A0AAD9XED6_9ROSI|nr:hypothetical protein Ddye_010880 [Dipteronia dyeriana]